MNASSSWKANRNWSKQSVSNEPKQCRSLHCESSESKWSNCKLKLCRSSASAAPKERRLSLHMQVGRATRRHEPRNELESSSTAGDCLVLLGASSELACSRRVLACSLDEALRGASLTSGHSLNGMGNQSPGANCTSFVAMRAALSCGEACQLSSNLQARVQLAGSRPSCQTEEHLANAR